MIFVFPVLYGLGALLLATAAIRRCSKAEAVAYTLSIALMAGAVVTALGQPRSLHTFVPKLGMVKVLAVSLEEQKHVFFWVQRKESSEPTAISMPWDEALASRAMKALEAARKSGDDVFWNPSAKPASGAGGAGNKGTLDGAGNGDGNGSSQGALAGDGGFTTPPHPAMPPKVQN